MNKGERDRARLLMENGFRIDPLSVALMLDGLDAKDDEIAKLTARIAELEASTVRLSGDLHQPPDYPIAFAVLNNDELKVYVDLHEADGDASDAGEDDEIYPLWASEGVRCDGKFPEKWR